MNKIDIWRTIPIFVSSTFKDMQAERDYLNTFLLLGNDIEGKSVTELEILFGALGNVNDILSRSLFFFRSSDSYEGIQGNKKDLYQEKDNDIEKKNRLLSLKTKIQQICENKGYTQAVHEYKLRWKDDKFEGIEAWGKLVFENLCREIREEIEATGTSQPQNLHEQEQHKLDRFIYYQTQRFVGREQLLTDSIDFLHNNDQAKILTAFSGAGKSSFMCELYNQLSSHENAQQMILFHSAGISQYTQQIENMLQNWSMRICKKLNLEYVEEVDDAVDEPFSNRLKEQFLTLVESAKKQGVKIILLVDALDRFQQDNMAKYMLWLKLFFQDCSLNQIEDYGQ